MLVSQLDFSLLLIQIFIDFHKHQRNRAIKYLKMRKTMDSEWKHFDDREWRWRVRVERAQENEFDSIKFIVDSEWAGWKIFLFILVESPALVPPPLPTLLWFLHWANFISFSLFFLLLLLFFLLCAEKLQIAVVKWKNKEQKLASWGGFGLLNFPINHIKIYGGAQESDADDCWRKQNSNSATETTVNGGKKIRLEMRCARQWEMWRN